MFQIFGTVFDSDALGGGVCRHLEGCGGGERFAVLGEGFGKRREEMR